MFLFIHPYLRGSMSFLHRLLPLACVMLFLGIVWVNFGDGLNIPALVWHDRPLLQASAGFSIAALFVYLWLVTYLLDARFHPEFIKAALERSRRSLAYKLMSWALPPAQGDVPVDQRLGGDGLRWYLGATFVPCTVLLLLPAFFVVNGTSPFVHFRDPDSESGSQLVIGERWPFAIGVGIVLFGIRGVSWLTAVTGRRLLSNERWQQLAHEYWLRAVAAVLFIVLAALYGILCVLVHNDAWQPPPITAACMLFGLIAGLTGFLWFHLRYFAVLAFVGLAVWVSVCDRPDYKLQFPHMAAEYERPLELDDHEEPPASLAEVGTDPAARKAEAERVAMLAATVESQRNKKLYTQQIYDQYKARGLVDPANYARLYDRYQANVAQLQRDELNVLRTWKNQFVPKGSDAKPKLVVLTATGGANRSGLWTAKVLYELHGDPDLKNFAKHLRIITGASGGMVGASYYVGSVQADGTLQAGFDPRDIAQDFLTPILNSLVFREVPFLALPAASYDRDRGEMLDRAMEGNVPGIDPAVRERLNNVFAKSFEDFQAGEDQGWRPSLIFSPMIVEDGRRLMISNRHVPFLTVYQGQFLLPNSETFGTAAPEAEQGGSRKIRAAQTKAGQRKGRTGDQTNEVYSRPAMEFFRLFPDARDRFHVSTAARMNATFPFVSPAVSLPTKAPRRVVDAGYYDNTGVSVAAAWLYEYRDWIAENCSGVVVIQVRDFASHRENRQLSLPAPQKSAFLPGLTGVLSAIDHARSSSANYRNDDDLRTLNIAFKEYFAKKHGPNVPVPLKDFLTTVVFERYSDVGMNWYLSEADKRDILGSWNEGPQNMNPASLKELKKWWARH